MNRGNAKFCSRSCSAAFGNRLRKQTPAPNTTCGSCDKEFYRKPSQVRLANNYCSSECFRKTAGRDFSKARIIEKIRKFTDEYGRIPIQCEFTAKNGWLSPRTVVEHFSSWNRAIEEAGFTPNSASIGYTCYAKDGHFCRSQSELVIDDWLTDNGITHEKEIRYPGSRLVADWRIGNSYIEYLGMDLKRDNKVSESYIKNLTRKRELCAIHGLVLIELRPSTAKDLERIILGNV